jgi:capsular exopolysaccharide synthesis family protein
MQLAQLERGRAYAEERYQSVVDQLQETRIQEETELGYADTVTEAAVPLEPIRPRTERNLVLGLIFGLLFGMGLAVGRDKLDSRMYKPEELKEASGQRLLGTIPNIGPLIQEQLDGVSTISVDGKQLASSLVAEVRPQSAAAEAFRHVRTNIQFSTSDVLLETLLVTSPGAGDGKTVTASNLAIVMAQAGRRTLLVDGDLRRPRLHDLFDLDRAPGLAELLASDADVSGSNIQKTPIENLQVLSAGASVDRPAERLSTAQLRTLLRSLKERFDFIVIDTPPVLAATDATYLSTQCEGTMVVARAGETTRPELQHALEDLVDVGATVIGMVLNGFDVSMAYGYTLRYRHYTRYGPYGNYQDSDFSAREPARSMSTRARGAFDTFRQAARASWASAWDAVSIWGGAAQQGGSRAVHTLSSFGQVLWTRGADARMGGQLFREMAVSVVRRADKAVQSAYRKSQPARDAVWSSAKAFGRLLHAKSVRLARRLRSRVL